MARVSPLSDADPNVPSASREVRRRDPRGPWPGYQHEAHACPVTGRPALLMSLV